MKALSFEGNGSEYFKIWIVNVLLTIITVGLYYPWAKVRNRRYFYGNTTLEGRNFEYHATGKQLFVGYIISMVLFIAYVVIQQISPIGSIVLLGILFLAIPWLVWRSFKFSMRMTSFSNVRFSFTGGLGQSYINFLLIPILFMVSIYIVPIVAAVFIPSLMVETKVASWVAVIVPIVIIASLVLAFYLYAYMKKRNSSYVINGSQYGQGSFHTNLETKKFLAISFKTLLLSILVIGLTFLLIGGIMYMTIGFEAIMEFKDNMKDPKAMHDMSKILPIIISVYGGLIISSILIMGYSVTRQRTYILENTTLDEKIKFASTLKAKSLIWVMITNLFAIIFTLGLAFPWVKVRMTRLIAENTLVDTEDGFDAYMTQKQKEESSLGEQIGDAFDVDVGLGF